MSYKLPTVSLKDIANEVGVSISLVSKVLNGRLGSTRVSRELAAKIHQVAQARNYRKNSSALSLRSGFHDSLSVMIHRHGEGGSPLVDYMVRGVFEEANRGNQKLLMGFFKEKQEFLDVCASAHRGLVDGLIIGGAVHNELCEEVLKLKQEGWPLVTILEEALHPSIPNVGINAMATGEMPTRHLIEQGCKTIGHLSVRPERRAGYEKAMNEAGFFIDEEWVVECGFDAFGYSHGVVAAQKWLKLGRIPDGVVAQSDCLAVGFMNTVREAGIRCPEDVLVIGVDDSPFCAYSLPSLSSVNQRNYPRGKKAVEMIMALREGGEVESIEFEPTLKVRRSTGGVPTEDLTGDQPLG
ncbi:LacI family DNA-binding transcriptional regulator [Kiritimatiellota bacterium B12222]|nr:LacI family DNA-binding transcriptional regulator [Kiritimatiellota bacterium B12222]